MLIVFVALVLLGGAAYGAPLLLAHTNTRAAQPRTDTALPSYTPEDLARYNGTDATLPIYLALDGSVYDVTAGRAYYAPGGAYHSLAGTDASRELHVFGGDIIKEKYPVVGILAASNE